MKALITRKIGMATALNDKGSTMAVTLLSALPNIVAGLKSEETDGYSAVQLGISENKRANKPLTGQFKKLGKTPKVVREFTIEGDEELTVGAELGADVFEVGDIVSATGVTKGKGFAGTIRRHNFHRGRKTHGGRSYRRPGSIGSMYPQRIFPGKKMAGRLGAQRVTTKNLRIAIINKEDNLIGVEGAIPGPKKGLVLLKGASK